MRIIIENLHRDVSEDEIREALRPFTPVDNIKLIREGSMPAALIEIQMTHAEAAELAMRLDGHLYKGRRLHAWVPLWNG
jgi:hypothetical protein